MVLISSVNSFASRLKSCLTKSLTFFIFFYIFLRKYTFILLYFLLLFSHTSFLSSVFFSLFKSPFLSSSFGPLLKILPNGEYSNLVCSTALGLKSISSITKYLYLSKLLEHNADILAAFLSKSYCALFYIIFLSKILI